MLFNIPMEPLTERYSRQWQRWFKKEFASRGVKFITINGESLNNKTNEESFLNTVGSNHYKMTQLTTICKLFSEQIIQQGDIFFFHNLWFPGLEMLAHIRDGMKIDFEIWGVFHGGTYDPNNFLSQCDMGAWGKDLENCWVKIVDGVFVGTQYHQQLIRKTRSIKTKAIVTGLPFYPSEFINHKIEKENIVVFPHRLDPEKNPDKFRLLKKVLQPQFPDWEFLMTKEVCGNKAEYYRLLNRGKIAVSFADQETFGMAMQEATVCGCIPVVPNRLSYTESYCDYFKYSSTENCINLIKYFMESFNRYDIKKCLKAQQTQFKQQGAEAIYNMLNVMGV